MEAAGGVARRRRGRCGEGGDGRKGRSVDARTARELCRLNDRFYRENASSFSSTRGAPWHGWRRCAQAARAELGASAGARFEGRPLRVLDLACGNLRFEGFLARELPEIPCECLAVDDCDDLARAGLACGPLFAGVDVRFRRLDVLGCLADAEDAGSGRTGGLSPNAAEGDPRALARALREAIGAPACDLAVCFGFMHHVPTGLWRRAVLRALAESLRPGGVACVSFWRFLDDARLARKAAEATERAGKAPELACLSEGFEAGDRFLGWQDRLDSFRYCHHFSDADIDGLAASVADLADPIARFRADGKDGMLNEYLVLRAK